jgi:hypothetical protein
MTRVRDAAERMLQLWDNDTAEYEADESLIDAVEDLRCVLDRTRPLPQPWVCTTCGTDKYTRQDTAVHTTSWPEIVRTTECINGHTSRETQWTI